MRVSLVNTYSTRNLGDAAIYAALEDRLDAHGAHRTVTDNVRLSDAFVSVGGDIFNNAREWLVTRNFARNVMDLARLPGERTMLFGQSLPPSCHGLPLQALGFVLRRLAAVSVRDELSLRTLRRIGVDAHLGLDTAFTLEPRPGWPVLGAELLQASGVDPTRAALISLRGASTMYRHDTSALLQQLAVLCQRLAKRGHQPAILLQSDVDGADNDRTSANWLRQRIAHLQIIDPFGCTTAAPWEAAAAATGAARLVIGVRYHTSVFRMMQGRAAFTLYYSNKGRDLVSRLGQPGCYVDDLDSERMISAIEASADQSVDAGALRRIARDDFAECFRRVGGQHESCEVFAVPTQLQVRRD